MFRKTITAVTLAAAGVTLLPGAAQAGDIQAAAKLEATAVVQSDKAAGLAASHAGKAMTAVRRSELAIKRAYAIARDEGRDAYVAFSAAAEAQGKNLSDVVEKSRGSLEREAASAMAHTARLEASLVDRFSQELERSEQVGSEQGDAAAELGDNHAGLTAEVAVVASEAKLREALARELDTVTRRSVEAQTRLATALAELRERSSREAEQDTASAQASLAASVTEVVEALRRGGRWEVSYEKTVGDESSPVQVSVATRVHASVGQGGRR